MAVLLGALALLFALAWGSLSRGGSSRERSAFLRHALSPTQLSAGLVHALISDRGFLRPDTGISSVDGNDIAIDRDGACGRLILHTIEGQDPATDLRDIAESARRITSRASATFIVIGGDRAFGELSLSSAGKGRTFHISETGAVTERGRRFGSAAPRLVIENALDRMGEDLERGGLPSIDRDTARSLISAPSFRHTGDAGVPLRGVVTSALTIAIAVCFAIQVLISPDSLRGDGAALSIVYRMGGVHQATILDGQWQRLLAAPFLHFGLIHLAANGWAQWSLGRPIEFLIGSWRFFLLWFLSGLGASLTSLVFNDTSVSAGASGAIFGLLGAFTTFVFIRKDILPQPVPTSLRNGVLATLLLNVMISFVPGIDMAAHAGGFVTGAVLALSMVRRAQGPRPSAWALRGAVCAVVLAGVGLTSYEENAFSTLRPPEIGGSHHIGELTLPIPYGFSVSETRQDGVIVVDTDGGPASPYSVTYRVSERQETESAARRLLPAFGSKSGTAAASDWIALSRVGVSGDRAIEIIVVAPDSRRLEAEALGSLLAKQIR